MSASDERVIAGPARVFSADARLMAGIGTIIERDAIVKRMLIFAGLVGVLAGFSGTVSAELPAALGPVDAEVVWVDFWASWCAPCRRSFPWMNSMHEKYGAAGLQIIGVNVDKDRALAQQFLSETPARFAVRYDPDGELAEAFDVQAMPSSFLLDRSGNVIAKHYGFRIGNVEEYEQSIRDALAARGEAANVGE